jgi:hypothetical protein
MATHYMIPNIWHSRTGNDGGNEMISGCQGPGGVSDKWWRAEDFS